MIKNIVSKIVVGGGVLAVALSVNLLYAWTPPGSIPPNSTVSLPLNVSTVNQTKSGSLSVAALTAYGEGRFQNWVVVGNTVMTSPPAQVLDVRGPIKIGTGTLCTSNEYGSLRYNSTLNKLELCNPSGWVVVE